MKRYISLLMGILGFIPILAQQSEYYYYYNGNRIDLEVDSTHFYVVSEGEFQSQSSVMMRSSDYKIVSSYKEQLSDNVALLQQRSLPSFVDTYCATLELSNRLDSFSYKELIESIKTERNVCQVLPVLTINGNPLGVTNKFYVKLKEETDYPILQQLSVEYGIEIVGHDKFMPLWYTLSCNKKSLVSSIVAANIFYESGLFAKSEPEMFGEISSQSNDPRYEKQWNLRNTGQLEGFEEFEGIDINVEEAWEFTKGENVVVAVYDDPICTFHEDLSSNIHSYSYDITTGGSSVFLPDSTDNHGTACAGIISAVQDNQIGISGIAPSSKIMSISYGQLFATGEQIANGFIKAYEEGADVISCSWSYRGAYCEKIDEALGLILEKCVVVFASGNDYDGGDLYYDDSGNLLCDDPTLGDNIGYPACSNPRILVVGGITPCGMRTTKGRLADGWIVNWSSNYGMELDVVAPSVEIYTLNYPNGTTPSNTYYYGAFGGTSAACPHAAGVAALIRSKYPELTADQVVKIMELSAKKVRSDLYVYQNDSIHTDGGWNEEVGYGLIDAGAAIKLADRIINTTYVNDTIIDGVELYINRDVELENIVMEPESFVEIYKDNRVFFKRNVLIKKGAEFIIYKEPYVE